MGLRAPSGEGERRDGHRCRAGAGAASREPGVAGRSALRPRPAPSAAGTAPSPAGGRPRPEPSWCWRELREVKVLGPPGRLGVPGKKKKKKRHVPGLILRLTLSGYSGLGGARNLHLHKPAAAITLKFVSLNKILV